MAARLVGAVLLTAVFCSPVAAAEKRPPSMEMLEFLAEFETAGGKTVDPQQFVASAEKEKTTKREPKSKKQQGQAVPVGTKGEKP